MCAKKPKKATGADIRTAPPSTSSSRRRSARIRWFPRSRWRSKIPAPIPATAAKAIAAPTPTPFPGASPTAAASDGAESADRLREALRRRAGQDSGGARRAPGAGSQHSRFGHARSLARFKQNLPARATATRWTSSPRTSAKSSAAWITPRKSTASPPANRRPGRHSRILRRAHQAALRSDRAGLPQRHHSRGQHALRPRPDRPQLPGQRHQQQFPRRVAPRRESRPDQGLLQDRTAITCSAWRTSWIS